MAPVMLIILVLKRRVLSHVWSLSCPTVASVQSDGETGGRCGRRG